MLRLAVFHKTDCQEEFTNICRDRSAVTVYVLPGPVQGIFGIWYPHNTGVQRKQGFL